jgi:hypothetical protein
MDHHRCVDTRERTAIDHEHLSASTFLGRRSEHDKATT